MTKGSMKRILLTLCVMWLFICSAGAENMTLPSPQCVSPGMTGWLGQDFSEKSLSVHASGSVEELFYIRDLTVLQNILSLIRIDVWVRNADGENITSVRLNAGDEPLSECVYTLRNGELLFAADGEKYRISESEMESVSDLKQFRSCFEAICQLLLNEAFPAEVDLKKVSENIGSGEFFRRINGLNAGNISVTENRTESQILTGLDLNGFFYCQDEPWSLSGSLSVKDGKAHTGNLELQVQKDPDNRLNIEMVSKIATEKQNKQRGTVAGNCRMTITGKRNGYDVRYGINQKVKNEWRLEDSNLIERVGWTVSMNWLDKTPGLKVRHLNTGSIEWKNSFSLETNESERYYSELHDDVSIELKMDGKNVIIASADIRLGKDDKAVFIPENGKYVSGEEARAITESVMEKISRKLYNMLESRSRNKVNQGL